MSPAGTVRGLDPLAARSTWAARAGPPAASLGSRLKAFSLTVLLVIVTLGVGWLVWSVVEWRHGRTVSFRMTGLRVVRRSDRRPVGLARSVLRNAVCCTALLVPTIAACALVALAFVMGASPPAGLLTRPRMAPWDLLTDTEVVDERNRRVTPSGLRLGELRHAAPVSPN